MSVSENQIVVYQPNETMRLDVRLENETVWLNRHQMAQLFGRDVKTIGKHIANALKEELSDWATRVPPHNEGSLAVVAKSATTRKGDAFPTIAKSETVRAIQCPVVAKFATTAVDGKTYQVEYYNLDVILSVGYRVKSPQGILFRRWANTVLREYLLRGYSINARLNQLEDKMDRRLAKHDQEIVELKDKVDFFVQTKEPPLQGIFYQNRYWDAKSLLIKFIRRAKKELIVIDAYVDVATLDMLAKRGRGVKIELITHSNGELEESDFEAFGAQCGKFTKTICGICHDRFIIVDGKEIFWTGASLKDAGRLTFAAAKMGAEVIPGLLASIRKATSESHEYGNGKPPKSRKSGKHG